ncbi:MAG: NAD(P)/FAD-dependent oxidoreductase [Ignavibacteriae bacterium]|nr:NAD(P)/FAD-dependent oxidoreductase [Ignavibacteriota bacterium]MCB9215780.1 NAD(P)/FAD-dependent oxidoreductase [Ignavibacteria bacterium]
MTNTFDIIVIGSGHNGLTTACYLAKAGMNVAVFERRDEIGGAVCTREMFGGYQMDVGGSAHIMIHMTPVIRELELEKFGLDYIEMDPWGWHPTEEGEWIGFYRDVDKTCQTIAKISEKDADAYYEFVKFWGAINDGVFSAFLKPPTPGNLLRTMVSGKFGKKKEVVSTLRKIFSSYGQVIRESFESTPMQAAMLWLAAQSGPPPSELATADFAGWQSMIHKSGAKRPRGGSGMLTQAMGRRLESDGGTIFTGAPIKRIIIENNRAVGVELESGERYGAAKGVIAATHVVMTMFGLIGRENLPTELAKRIDNLRIGNGFGMILRCASDELPNYSAMPHNPAQLDVDNPHPSHTGLQLLCPTPEYLDHAYADYLRGIPSRDPACLLMTFSAIDETLAPKGKHTVFIWSQYHPYELANGESWDNIREREAEKLIDVATRYAPNLKGAITDYYIQTPLDIERLHGMHRGNVMHLEMSFDQMFLFRPTPELSDYTTPFENLYLTGASTHPGGGIFAASGYNTAQVVLKKSGNRKWFGR